jgi:hypothetical protein
MGDGAEQRRIQAAFPQTTETRLKDVFDVYEKLQKELLQHIEQLRSAGWLSADAEAEPAADPGIYAASENTQYEPDEPPEFEPAEYNGSQGDGRYAPRY